MFANAMFKYLTFCLWSGFAAGTLLLTGCGERSPESSQELAVQGLYSASISDHGALTLIGSINHGASLWADNWGERLYNWNHQSGEYSEVTSVAFSPNANFAITTTPLTMVVWNRNTGEGINYWNAPSEILDVDLLSAGRYALLGLVDHTATLFDVVNGGAQRVYNHKGRVNSVDSHVLSNQILTGSDDFSAKLWNLTTAEILHDWPMEEEVQLVRLSPDGNMAFGMAKYSSAKIFDTRSGLVVSEVPLGRSAIRRGTELTAARFSNDGSYLLTGNGNRLIQLWRSSNMDELARWETPRRNKASPNSAAVLDVAFVDENTFYAITSDGFGHILRR
jgi:WD40 repeat protein